MGPGADLLGGELRERWSSRRPFAPLTARIAAVLNNTLTWIEGERAGKVLPQVAAAVDLLLRARDAAEGAARMEQTCLGKRGACSSARSPSTSTRRSADAFLGVTLVNLWNENLGGGQGGLLRRAEEHGRRASSSIPGTRWADMFAGMVRRGPGQRFDQALAAFETRHSPRAEPALCLCAPWLGQEISPTGGTKPLADSAAGGADRARASLISVRSTGGWRRRS